MTMMVVRADATIGTDAHVDLDDVTFSSAHVLVGSIPRSQLYFWSAEWQELERQASEDIETGDTVTFDDPLDVIRWLNEGDE